MIARAEPGRFVRFCAVGASSYFIQQTVLWLLTEALGVHYMVSGAVSVELAILYVFTGNELWTFRDRRHGRSLPLRAAVFNLSRVASLALNLAVLWSLTELAGLHYLASNTVGIGLATVVNYYLARRFVWAA